MRRVPHFPHSARRMNSRFNHPPRRIVIKLGTSVLTGGSRHLSQPRMVALARQCATLHRQGHEIILCSSGAIAAGRSQLGFPDLTNTIAHKQMLAAVGQTRLMLTWARFFGIYDLNVGQILLTHADVESRRRFLNAQDTLRALLTQHIIPVINENDVVATDEIKIGDNDNLSALVTVLAEADLLIILTDQAGLFTSDPHDDPHAELIPEVREIDETVLALAGDSRSGLGTGGMVTKLQAATVARRAGAEVIIADGGQPDVLLRLVAGEPLGTYFPAPPRSPESRKRRILAGAVKTGRIVIDAGAAQALRHAGRSLLPAGITAVEGTFERGDTVSILGPERLELARGIVRYDADSLRHLCGRHSDDIPKLLGYTYGAVAVHRNDLVVL